MSSNYDISKTERSEFSLVLKERPSDITQCVKTIISINPIRKDIAREMANNTPAILKKSSNVEEITIAKDRLNLYGFVVEIVETSSLDDEMNYSYITRITRAEAENRKKSQSSNALGFGIIVIILSIIIFMIYGSQNEGSRKSKYEDMDYYIVAEKIVKSELKAPSTAKFSGYNNSEVSYENDKVLVTGYVDSENSFGAFIRSRFIVVFDKDDINIYEFKIE